MANLSFSAACRNPQAGMRGPVTELLPQFSLPGYGLGRGAGVGRGLGVGVHLPVHGVGVGVGVGVGPNWQLNF